MCPSYKAVSHHIQFGSDAQFSGFPLLPRSSTAGSLNPNLSEDTTIVSERHDLLCSQDNPASSVFTTAQAFWLHVLPPCLLS